MGLQEVGTENYEIQWWPYIGDSIFISVPYVGVRRPMQNHDSGMGRCSVSCGGTVGK